MRFLLALLTIPALVGCVSIGAVGPIPIGTGGGTVAPSNTLQTQLSGRSLSTGYGAIALEFNGNGSVIGLANGQILNGSWTASGQTLCLLGVDPVLTTVFSPPVGNCFVATVTADHVVLLSQSGGGSHRFVLF